MNPLLKENQILRMISDASSLKKNNDQSLYWIEVFCNCRRILKVAIPSKRQTYESLDESMEDVRDKAVEVLFDLSMLFFLPDWFPKFHVSVKFTVRLRLLFS